MRPALGAGAAAMVVALGAQAETWHVSPSVAVRETFSDNFLLATGDAARSGWYTDVVPGLRAEVMGARLRGFADLRLDAKRYAGDSRLDENRRFLESQGTFEAVENRVFLDARAYITQENLSAFGAASTPDQPSASGNQVETSVLRISPWIRGKVPDVANYHVRYDAAGIRADDPALADTRTGEWIARIASASPSARLGWALYGSALDVRNDEVGHIVDRRVRGRLAFAVTPQLRLSVLGGVEETDFAGPPRTRTDTPGAGIAWTPGDRTQLAGVVERRFFGNGHSVFFSHRTARLAFRLASVRDAAVFPGARSAGESPARALMADLLASTVEDPEERAREARRRLEESGIAPFSSLGSSSLTSSPVVFRVDEASAAMVGARNTVTVTAMRREQRTIGAPAGAAPAAPDDDFRRRGIDANWAYRLTPVTTVTLTATALRTVGQGAVEARSDEDRIGLVVSSRLGPKTLATMGVRHSTFDTLAGTGSYRESAAYASFSVRF
ncbi:MAG: TIGR03016 family PEP-CTERM system-associated outer membrane protein [Lysobacter sp.]|nr:TIGR03016 family PEP-CTERM system-associated outer membrane protein [Lysobacter sp.]